MTQPYLSTFDYVEDSISFLEILIERRTVSFLEILTERRTVSFVEILTERRTASFLEIFTERRTASRPPGDGEAMRATEDGILP